MAKQYLCVFLTRQHKTTILNSLKVVACSLFNALNWFSLLSELFLRPVVIPGEAGGERAAGPASAVRGPALGRGRSGTGGRQGPGHLGGGLPAATGCGQPDGGDYPATPHR